jgi:solute carrier family 25 thiamine pyrophosphate transporter 19
MATAPLDLIRIRRQLAPRTLYPSESIWQSWTVIVEREGGIRALYRGNLAAIYLWMGYSGVQFSLYRHATAALERWRAPDLLGGRSLPPTAVAFVAGATAGVVATLATYPFDVCRTTFAARGLVSAASAPVPEPPPPRVPFHSLVEPPLQCPIPRRSHPAAGGPPPAAVVVAAAAASPPKPPSTLVEFAWFLYRSQGLRGFYAGAGPAVLQVIPYMGMTFGLYELLTSSSAAATGDDDETGGVGRGRTVTVAAYAGSISGAVSKLAVYPLDTIKRRLQAQAFYASGDAGFNHHPPYRGMTDCARRILAEEGIASFYRGVVPSVLKSAVASSLSFALYRSTRNALERWHDSGL